MEQKFESSFLDGRVKVVIGDLTTIKLADERDLKSIAFPSISTGAFGYPKDHAARISSLSIKESLEEHPSITEVRLVFFQPSDARVFLQYQIFG